MKKVLSLCTLCTLAITPTWLDAKPEKPPQSTPAQQDSASIVRKVDAKLDAINKRGYLDELTLDQLKKDIQDMEKGIPSVFKPAWEGLLDILTAIKSDMNAYDHLSADNKSAKLIEKARKNTLDIQDKVVTLLKKIEDAIEDNKIEWKTRNTLLNIYKHLTDEWVNNPYGIDAGYKEIIYGKDGEDGLVDTLKKAQQKSIPRPTVMFRGAPMVMTPSN